MVQRFPQQFGKYVLLRKIAMGGMAEIFLAKTLGAEGFEKDVVIKRILPHFTEDEDFVTMFIDEARIASRLAHANIVQIFDFNQLDGSYFIAMEYIEGTDLNTALEEATKLELPLSVPQCVWVVMELAKGLHYAHTKQHQGKPLNIVHRDVSPHNTMVAYTGEIKLMDFGIAKAASRSTETQAGQVKGKCAFMSPEQAKGQQLDGRSDVFSLGVMLWELVTGSRLFVEDSDFMTLSNVLKMEAPPPSSVNPSVDTALDPIILKALGKKKEERHASAQDFGRELTKWFYGSVDDLDAVSLGPWMQEVFADEYNARHLQEEEEKTLFLTAEAGLAGPEEKTAALQAIEPERRGELRQGGVDRERREALSAAKARMTKANEVTARNTHKVGQDPPRAAARGSKTWLWVALVVLLLGGGATAAILATGGAPDGVEPVATAPADPESKAIEKPDDTEDEDEDEDEDEEDEAPETKSEPSDNKDGRPKETAKSSTTVVEAKPVPREGTTAKSESPSTVTVVIAPSRPDAEVFAGGKLLGKGEQRLTGTPGQVVQVTVAPPVGKGLTKTVVLSADKPRWEFDLGQAAAPVIQAQLLVKCAPATAAVTASAGTVQKVGADWAVTGLTLGQQVRVQCGQQVQDVVVSMVVQQLALAPAGETKVASAGTPSGKTTTPKPAEPKKPTPKPTNTTTTQPKKPKPKVTGWGTVSVNAIPWAKCSVGSVRNKMTPLRNVKVKAGRVRVKCSKPGEQPKSKTVKVKPNGEARVVISFK